MSLLRADLANYKPASNLHFNEVVKQMKADGHRVYHLAFGQSPFPIIPHAELALQKFAGTNDYLPSNGILQLRVAISEFHKYFDGVNFDPENIVVGPGSKELIFLLTLVFGGDVLLISPTWTTYKPQTLLSGKSNIILETKREDNWKLTPAAIEKTMKNGNKSLWKLLIFCNPDNPTGTSYTEQELQDLSKVFRRHKILVLSDEIYGRLLYDGKHTTLSKVYPEGTIVSSGLSKWASAGGWRLGYLMFPDDLHPLRDAVKSAGSHTYSCAPAPMQYAAETLLKDIESCEEYIKHTSRILSCAANYCFSELSQVGITSIMPTAGYYIFPDFEIIRQPLLERGIRTGEEMCAAILHEASVALLAGGPNNLRSPEELTVRLCYVNFDGSTALVESQMIGLSQPLPEHFIKKHCVPLYEAIQVLTLWVRKQLGVVQESE